MAVGTDMSVEYVAAQDLAGWRTRDWQGVLGIALFAADSQEFDAGKVPVARVGMRPLAGPAALCEVWRAPGQLASGATGQVRYRTNGRVAFGAVMLDETATGAGAGGGQMLRAATARAYTDIFQCVGSLGLPRVIRMWNYFPEITREIDGVERYRHFNEARQKTFQSCRFEVSGRVPAACALGSPPGGPLVVYFLAGADDVTAIENPRQVSAYEYPNEYGAFSPTFSRATVSGDPSCPMLFISGTASILGHRTVHSGDVLAQARETVANIRALVGEANRAAGGEFFVPERFQYKVYVRRLADLAAIAAELAATIHPAASIVYLHADICRPDLLVEIEATGAAAQQGAH